MLRRHQQGAGDQRRGDRDEERRGEAAKASQIEAAETERSRRRIIKNDARDQEAADDEKDIDAEIAAVETRNIRVEKKDRADSERAKTVDLAPIAAGLCFPWVARLRPSAVSPALSADGSLRP